MATSAVPPARRLVGAAFSAGLTALLLTSCAAAEFSAPGDAGSGAQEHAPGAAEDRAAEGAEGGAAVEEEGGGSSPVGSDVEVGERDLVHTADLTVRVEDVAEASELAKELTIDAGGYVASESLSTPAGGTPDGSLTLRVPNEGYEGALDALGGLGERSQLQRSVVDVTEEVADVESRITSSEASLETLRGYLEEAEDVDDLLRVESEIQTRQSELESFQARLETLTNQTTYSTVNLRLTPPQTYLEDPPEEGLGFLGGLERGWRALGSLGEGVAVVVGWLLPFLVTAAVLGAVPLWWLRSRRRAAGPKGSRGRAGRAPAPAASARSGVSAPAGPGARADTAADARPGRDGGAGDEEAGDDGPDQGGSGSGAGDAER